MLFNNRARVLAKKKRENASVVVQLVVVLPSDLDRVDFVTVAIMMEYMIEEELIVSCQEGKEGRG